MPKYTGDRGVLSSLPQVFSEDRTTGDRPGSAFSLISILRYRYACVLNVLFSSYNTNESGFLPDPTKFVP